MGPVIALFCLDADVHHLRREPKWRDVELVVDSGAAESVAPKGTTPLAEPGESAGATRDQTYLSACGDKLPKMGDKQFDSLLGRRLGEGVLPGCRESHALACCQPDVLHEQQGGVRAPSLA